MQEKKNKMSARARDLEFFEDHKIGWRSYYIGWYMLIESARLIGAYKISEEAWAVGKERFGRKSFLVKRLEK